MKPFTATVRKNKANNHKYVTIPRKNNIQEGEEVEVKPKESSISE